VGAFPALRTALSRSSGLLAHALFPRRLRRLSDPLSGFFLVRRRAIDLTGLRPRGFKILLEILVRSGPLKTSEVAFCFGERHAGESKASMREGVRYLRRLIELRAGRPRARAKRTASRARSSVARRGRGALPIGHPPSGTGMEMRGVTMPSATVTPDTGTANYAMSTVWRGNARR
jgi:hypothetical protein